MKELSKKDLEELKSITEQITLLKLERMQKFGKDWHNLLLRQGRVKQSKMKVHPNKIQRYVRQMDEICALKGYSISKLSNLIGIHRGAYYHLRDGSCSNEVYKVLESTDWENI